MAPKKTAAKDAVNLFEHALAVTGIEPLEISIGGVDILLRRSHSAKQITDWLLLEEQHEEAIVEILASEVTPDEKDGQLREQTHRYILGILTNLSAEKIPDTALSQAADNILTLPQAAWKKVFRSIGKLSGVTDEAGIPFPTSPSSETRSSTTA